MFTQRQGLRSGLPRKRFSPLVDIGQPPMPAWGTNQPAHVARRAVNAGLRVRNAMEIEKDHRSILQIFSMN